MEIFDISMQRVQPGRQQLWPLQALGLATGGLHLHGLLVGQEQPAKLGTVGLVEGHLAAQGAHTTRPFVAGA